MISIRRQSLSLSLSLLQQVHAQRVTNGGGELLRTQTPPRNEPEHYAYFSFLNS